ncbi:MAG: hypothetical protein K5930_00410 [Treponemataceae bacterium]|nr:hypothetical protein [Treponemataceae bacterium]
MRTIRKLAAMLLIVSLCFLGLFAYDQNFDEIVVAGEWIASTTEDNFKSIASNIQTWHDFSTECLGQEPDSFYNVTPENMDEEDKYVIDNLAGYIEAWGYVEDNDVYAYTIARSIEEETGFVPEGWLVLCHYSANTNKWTFYMYYFGIQY